MVGAINKRSEEMFGDVLSPYLARDDTFCVVSSDFCHWCAEFATELNAYVATHFNP